MKHCGRNTLVLVKQINTHMRDGIYLYGQVICNSATNKAHGIELLGRPAHYTGDIEQYFRSLDHRRAAGWTQWQLERATNIMQQTGLQVNVNVDTLTLTGLDFSGYASSRLGIEFTYTQQLPTPDQIMQVRKQLPRCQMILDDYKLDSGLFTGKHEYAFSMFDIIKLDISVMEKIRSRSYEIGLIRSMIKVLLMNNVEIIIEGVETEHDVSLVRDLGIQYAQGFYYGKPKLLADLIDEFT